MTESITASSVFGVPRATPKQAEVYFGVPRGTHFCRCVCTIVGVCTITASSVLGVPRATPKQAEVYFGVPRGTHFCRCVCTVVGGCTAIIRSLRGQNAVRRERPGDVTATSDPRHSLTVCTVVYVCTVVALSLPRPGHRVAFGSKCSEAITFS